MWDGGKVRTIIFVFVLFFTPPNYPKWGLVNKILASQKLVNGSPAVVTNTGLCPNHPPEKPKQ